MFKNIKAVLALTLSFALTIPAVQYTQYALSEPKQDDVYQAAGSIADQPVDIYMIGSGLVDASPLYSLYAKFEPQITVLSTLFCIGFL